MITAIFKNANGSYRVINWHAAASESHSDELRYKSLPDLIHDFGAETCHIITYDKPKHIPDEPRKNNTAFKRAATIRKPDIRNNGRK